MKRRSFIVAAIGAVFGGLMVASTPKPLLREIYLWHCGRQEWQRCRLREINRGDVFMVLDTPNPRDLWVAESYPEFADGRWQIGARPFSSVDDFELRVCRRVLRHYPRGIFIDIEAPTTYTFPRHA